MEVIYDLAICGGGPAGAGAAITAARQGGRVLLLERGQFPRHKVCGEFISSESLSLLSSLLAGTDGERLLAGAPRIGRARIFSDGTVVEAAVEPAAASIARYDLDIALWQAAERAGVECHQQAAVTAIEANPGGFFVGTEQGSIGVRTVIDASGRWSNLTRTEDRPPRQRWLGVKAHFAADEDVAPSVDLYFFPGGYCGVQPLGVGRLNACAMVRADVVAGRQTPGGSLLEQVLALHPQLQERSRWWRQVTELVTTSPLVFRVPVPERDGILLVGDAAGFIDPFAGDGISLALQTGAAAAAALSKTWTSGATLPAACEAYGRFYQESILPVFTAAGRVRRLLSMPVLLRRPLLALLRAPGLADLLVHKTRLRPPASLSR